LSRSDRLYAAAFVIAWSGGFIGIEFGTRQASALTLLTWRFIVLAVPAAIWLAWRRPKTNRRDLALHLVIAVLAQIGYLGGIALAAQLGVAPGAVSLIAALQPLVMALAAVLFLAERMRAVQTAGLGVGLVGVVLVVAADAGGGSAPWWAFALPFASVLGMVAATVLERRTRPDSLGPVDALAVQFLLAAAVFTALAAALGELPPPPGGEFWIGVAWTVLFAGIGGYGLYWAVVRRSGATTVSNLLYLTPPTTLLWAWLMFGERLTALAWIGLAVCAAGVLLALRGSGARRPEAAVPR
jgi:drug/metabolite transporter (DMT)-like permease